MNLCLTCLFLHNISILGVSIMAEKEINNQTNEPAVEEKVKLPFAKNEVYRLMRQNLDSDKIIRDRVKVEMNKFLAEILKNVCKQLNDIHIQQ